MPFSNDIAFGSIFIKYSCYIYVCLSVRKKSVTTERKFINCAGEFLVKSYKRDDTMYWNVHGELTRYILCVRGKCLGQFL